MIPSSQTWLDRTQQNTSQVHLVHPILTHKRVGTKKKVTAGHALIAPENLSVF